MFKRNLIIITFYLFLLCDHSSGENRTKSLSKKYATLPILFLMDNYDDCMLLEEEALFCSVTYQLYPRLYPSSNTALWLNLKYTLHNGECAGFMYLILSISETCGEIFTKFIWDYPEDVPYQIKKNHQNLFTDWGDMRHDILRHGICVPKTCPNATFTLRTLNDSHLRQELTKCYNEKYRSLGLSGNITTITCDTVNPKYPIDWIDISFGYFLLLYASFVIFATFCELRISSQRRNQNREPNTWERIIIVFSVRRNWIRLKTINWDPDTKRLRCIQGVRFYNMVLVILVHTIMTLFVTLPISNTRATETLTERLSTVFLASGPLCVSTFFLISSWLLIYGMFEKYKDKKEIRLKVLLVVFINRYIRLTPSLVLIVAFQATWLRHLGTGPNWNNVVVEEYLRCRKNWWTNILYVNNYIDPKNMCMQTTWHLALDTQYFTIILLSIWLIKKHPIAIWIILGSLLALSVCVSFLKNYLNDFPALIPPTPESLYGMNHTLKNIQWHIQYIGFFGNMAGPIIGLGFGYAYAKYKNQNILTKDIHIWLWYFIVYGCCFGTILITGFLSLPEHIAHDRFWASVHVAISRPIFATGVSILLFGMTQGIGGLMKSVFEWHPLYVLGRLTYSAYLVHVPLLLFRGGLIRSPVYINEYSVFFELMGHLSVSYLVAAIFTLLFEMPLSELQKLILQRSKTIIVRHGKNN